LTGAIVGKDAKALFYEVKGVIESMSKYCHMEDLHFEVGEKPTWADCHAYLQIMHGNVVIGTMGLVSLATLKNAKIKRVSVGIFELNVDGLVPFLSRTNEFRRLPQFPLVEKDLSILVDEGVAWNEISKAIGSKVKELSFIEEYRGEQIPEGKKSIMLRVKIGKHDSTMTTDEITSQMNSIIHVLSKKCGAELREE